MGLIGNEAAVGARVGARPAQAASRRSAGGLSGTETSRITASGGEVDRLILRTSPPPGRNGADGRQGCRFPAGPIPACTTGHDSLETARLL